jgi:hypothetical protein
VKARERFPELVRGFSSQRRMVAEVGPPLQEPGRTSAPTDPRFEAGAHDATAKAMQPTCKARRSCSHIYSGSFRPLIPSPLRPAQFFISPQNYCENISARFLVDFNASIK